MKNFEQKKPENICRLGAGTGKNEVEGARKIGSLIHLHYIVSKCFSEAATSDSITRFRVTVTFLILSDGNKFTSKCEQKRKQAIQEEVQKSGRDAL